MLGASLTIPAYRMLDFVVNSEIQFGGKADRAKHPDGIFTKTFIGVPDDDQKAPLHILESIDVVPNAEIRDVVIECVAGEIAAPDIFVDAAINIVSKYAAPVIVCNIGVFLAAISRCPKCRNFDDLPAEAYVCKSKSTPNKAAV